MSKPKPRELTRDEVQARFLRHVRDLARYWERQTEGRTTLERMEGLAFSILTLLDGGTALPSFAVIPVPHPDDKDFHARNGENWYPSSTIESDCDIAGDLHERFINPL